MDIAEKGRNDWAIQVGVLLGCFAFIVVVSLLIYIIVTACRN